MYLFSNIFEFYKRFEYRLTTSAIVEVLHDHVMACFRRLRQYMHYTDVELPPWVFHVTSKPQKALEKNSRGRGAARRA